MSVLLEKNGTTTAEVTMINARGILLFVGGKNIIYRMTDILGLEMQKFRMYWM